MKKICKNCQREKELTSFYVKSNSSDGLQSVCKICTSTIQKQYREKRKEGPKKKVTRDTKMLTINGTTKQDYCQMYSAMSKLYPNKELDIHTQFCLKWGLNVSKYPRKGPANHYTYEDCQE